MPKLKYDLRGFPTNRSASLDVSFPQLCWAAATIGAVHPFIGTSAPRPLLEMMWRTAMVSSSLQVWNDSWQRSDSYDRLDPSEKTAVSYFLGMTQSQITVATAFGQPSHLIHLDRILEMLGIPRARQRPDFLAVDVAGTVIGTFESKGRSGPFSAKTLADAKIQSQLVPTPIVSTPTTVASLAWFDNKAVWRATLADPEAEHPPLDVSSE